MIYEKEKVDGGYLVRYGEKFTRDGFNQFAWRMSFVKNKNFSPKYLDWVYPPDGIKEINILFSIGMDKDVNDVKEALSNVRHVVSDYDEIGKDMILQPYDYQKEIIKFILDNQGGLIVAPCGSGKSPMGIGTYLEAKKRGLINGPGAIIVKASLKVQWVKEVSKFAHLTANGIYTKADFCSNEYNRVKTRKNAIKKLDEKGSLTKKEKEKKAKKKREIIALYKEIDEKFKMQFQGYDLFVLNYETVNDPDVRETLKEAGIEYIMADEIHYIKNREAKRSLAMADLGDVKFKVGATATPVGKSPEDLFGIFRFVSPELFPKWSDFSKTYLKYSGGKFGRVSGVENKEQLTTKIQKNMIVKSKHDVSSQLPKLVVTPLVCRLSYKQQQVHTTLMEELDDLHEQEKMLKMRMRSEDELRSNEDYLKISAGILARQTFAQQLCITEELLLKSDSNMAKQYTTGDSSSKMELLKEKVGEILNEGEKVCIFSRYTSLQDILIADFKRAYPNVGVAVIRGELSAQQRYIEAYDKFRDDDKYKILLCSNAGAEGLNLSKCKYLIEVERAESFGIQTQRYGRLERADSIHDTAFVYQLVCEESWDDIAQKIVDKKQKYDEELIRGM